MAIRVGEFHRVVAVGATQRNISILDTTGFEWVIPILPVWNRRERGFNEIEISGGFGSFDHTFGGGQIPNLFIRDVTRVEVQIEEELLDPDADADYHCRLLLVHTPAANLQIELFCEDRDLPLNFHPAATGARLVFTPFGAG